MRHVTWWVIGILAATVAGAGGCREEAGDGDGDGDGDADGDGDGDGDGDADGDADGDTDGDADGDTDGDADSDGDGDADGPLCEVADGVNVNECADCLPSEASPAVQDALALVFPTADAFRTESGEAGPYYVAERSATVIGYGFLGSNYGFEGPVVALTGIDVAAQSVRLELTEWVAWEWVDMQGPWFFEQLQCLDLTQVNVSARTWGPYNVDVVSGASTTSRAILADVWDAIAQYDAVVGL
jgi:hypothetical protein